MTVKVLWPCAVHDERASQLMEDISTSLQIGASADGLQTMQVAAQLSSRPCQQLSLMLSVPASQIGFQPTRPKQQGPCHSGDMLVSASEVPP